MIVIKYYSCIESQVLFMPAHVGTNISILYILQSVYTNLLLLANTCNIAIDIQMAAWSNITPIAMLKPRMYQRRIR